MPCFWEHQLYDQPESKCVINFFLNEKVAGIYMIQVNNRNTRTTCEICSKLDMICLYCLLWTYFKPCSRASIVNFAQAIASLALTVWKNSILEIPYEPLGMATPAIISNGIFFRVFLNFKSATSFRNLFYILYITDNV